MTEPSPELVEEIAPIAKAAFHAKSDEVEGMESGEALRLCWQAAVRVVLSSPSIARALESTPIKTTRLGDRCLECERSGKGAPCRTCERSAYQAEIRELRSALGSTPQATGGVRARRPSDDIPVVTPQATGLSAIAQERDEVVACEDCARPYRDGGFPDLIIPNAIWRRISTHGDETGLLCPSCICARLEKAGISEVEAAFMSGPIQSVTRPTMYALRGLENLEERFPPPIGEAYSPSNVRLDVDAAHPRDDAAIASGDGKLK